MAYATQIQRSSKRSELRRSFSDYREKFLPIFQPYLYILYIRAREIDKCQSVRQFSKSSAISGRTYGNSRLEVYIRIYVTFEFRKSLDRGYRRELWCMYLYIAASLFTKYLSIFLDVLSAERILKQNKNTSEFPRINSCCFRRQAHSSSSVRVQSAK